MSKLSPNAILQGMAEALPTHQKGDDGSDLASSYEAIALLIHSYLAAIHFKLVGFDEEKPLRKVPPPSPNSTQVISNQRLLTRVSSRSIISRPAHPLAVEQWLRLPQLRLYAQAIFHDLYHTRRSHGQQGRGPRTSSRR